MNTLIETFPGSHSPMSAPTWRGKLLRAAAVLHREWARARMSEAAAELLARAERLEATQPSYAADLRHAAHRAIESSLRTASAGSSNGRW